MRRAHMFTTLRAKLIFTYMAVVALSLVLALVVLAALATRYGERSIYRSLHDKSALAYPFVQLELSGQLRPAFRPLQTRVREGIIRSGTRILLVDPSNMSVVEDISMRYHAAGERFSLDVPDSEMPNLYLARGVEGKFKLQGEDTQFLYVARSIPVPGATGGAKNSTDTMPPDTGLGITQPLGNSYIVVLAQPVQGIQELAQDVFGYLGWAAVIALLLSLIVAYWLARSISRPIARLAEGTAAMARGDYNTQLPVEGRDELAALTARFNEMAQEVGRAHQMERDFVANVSHDLKTPLTSIQGFSQAMVDGSIVEPEGHKQAAGIINGEAERMNRLVSELLNLSRLQNGLQSLDLRPTELAALLGELVTAMQPQASQAGIQLRMAAQTQEAWVSADRDRLKQAYGNVVDNALKYTPSGGTVTLELQIRGSGVETIVRDTGIGIPGEDIARVTERFYQVDKSRSSLDGRSAGLGLAITREIVRAHHGEIHIASTPTAGTAVTIYLPLDPSHQANTTRSGVLKLLGGAGRRGTGSLGGPAHTTTTPPDTNTTPPQGPHVDRTGA